MRYYFILILSVFFCKAHSQQLSWEWSSNPSSFADSYRRIHQIDDSIFQISGYIGNPIIMNLTRIKADGDTISYLNLTGLPNNYFILDHYFWKDNGFIVTGESDNARSWLAGLDSTGNIVWQHFLNTNAGFSEITRIRLLNDGGYLFIGHRLTDANQYYSDVLAGRLDSLGNIIWEKYFPIINNQTAHDFVEMPDGSFFISGYSETVALGATPYIMQIDIKGNLIAEHYPQINGFANMDISYSRIDLMKNGGAIMTGQSSDPINSKKAFIINLDSSFNILWDTIFIKGSTSVIKPQESGGALFQGYTLDSGIFLIELDGNGNTVKYFGQPNGLQKTMLDIELSSEGFLIGVGKDGIPGQSLTNELYAARYDSVGVAFVPDYCAWNLPEAAFYYDYQAPTLTLYDSSFSGLQYHDSIYQFQWYTSQGDMSFSDSLLTLFDSTGNNTLDVTLIVSNWHGCQDTLVKTLDFKVNLLHKNLSSNDILIYPNPAETILNIEFGDKSISDYSIRMFDLLGKEYLFEKNNSKILMIDISVLSSGLYVAEIETEKGLIRKKILKK